MTSLPPSISQELTRLGQTHMRLLEAGRDKQAGSVKAEARIFLRQHTRLSLTQIQGAVSEWADVWSERKEAS